MNKLWDVFCKVSLVIIIILFVHSMLGDIMFRLQYSFPKVSEITSNKINTYDEPIQNDLAGDKYIKARGDKKYYALNLQAEYSLSGLVVAKNSNFWFRDVMRSKFDGICLLDLGIVWGELAQDKRKLFRHFKFKSTKTLGQARQLQPRCKGSCANSPWEIGYFDAHISHTHLIPANANVMGGLLKIKKGDVVKLDGYLVDIYTDKSELVALTSMSRADNNATSRGYGACEDMYVKSVQIGDKIYR